MGIIVMHKKEILPTIQHVLTGGVALFPFLSQTKDVKDLGRYNGYVNGWITNNR